MKYTNYILHDSLNFEGVGIIAIPSAVMGMPILVGFLGGALIMDSERYLKLRYLLFKREQRNLNYIKCVIRSLDRVPNNQLIGLLKAA